MTNENGVENGVNIVIEPHTGGFIVEILFYDAFGKRYPYSVGASIETISEVIEFITEHTLKWYSPTKLKP